MRAFWLIGASVVVSAVIVAGVFDLTSSPKKPDGGGSPARWPPQLADCSGSEIEMFSSQGKPEQIPAGRALYAVAEKSYSFGMVRVPGAGDAPLVVVTEEPYASGRLRQTWWSSVVEREPDPDVLDLGEGSARRLLNSGAVPVCVRPPSMSEALQWLNLQKFGGPDRYGPAAPVSLFR